MTGNKTALLIAGFAGAFALLHSRAVAGVPRGVMTADEVRGLAESVVRAGDLRAEPAMMVRLAWIESSFNPEAVRAEPQIADASAGLMQTLVGTAQWLHDDMGYRQYARPTLSSLMGPQTSLYYGGAYLSWLSRYNGRSRPEEWIVRGYNGGPGGATASYTDGYWSKYLAAKGRLG